MILDNDKILRVCNRLACQIVEVSDGSNKIVLVGIKEKGFEIAKIIEKQIKFFSSSVGRACLLYTSDAADE